MEPVNYDNLKPYERRKIREAYVAEQNNLCMFCNSALDADPPKEVTDNPINWSLFPPGFLKYPVHLQHNHDTGMTEGAVHAYCNAVLWQYFGR